MSLDLAVALFYALGFAFMCHQAVREGVTVWILFARVFNDLARGMETVLGALGIVPKPQRPQRVSQARIKQLERELDIR